MPNRPLWKRAVDVLVFLFLALAAAAAVSGVVHADSWFGVVFALAFLALFLGGLYEIVRIMLATWRISARR